MNSLGSGLPGAANLFIYVIVDIAGFASHAGNAGYYNGGNKECDQRIFDNRGTVCVVDKFTEHWYLHSIARNSYDIRIKAVVIVPVGLHSSVIGLLKIKDPGSCAAFPGFQLQQP